MPKGYNTTAQARADVVKAAMAGYAERANEHYTQDSRRWSGIDHKIMPPKAPPYSDCSSFSTWCYWTTYGNGPDFLNGESWKAGYTGTLTKHGKVVALASAQPGDLVFYGKPTISHVAVFVGEGKVVTHGHDPVEYTVVHYRSDYVETRSYL